MKKIKRRPSLTTTIVIIIEIRRNISAPALSAVEIEDGIISMPVLDSDWSVFSLFVEKLTIFIFKLRTSDPFFSLPPELAFQEGDFDSEESAFVNLSSDTLCGNSMVWNRNKYCIIKPKYQCVLVKYWGCSGEISAQILHQCDGLVSQSLLVKIIFLL